MNATRNTIVILLLAWPLTNHSPEAYAFSPAGLKVIDEQGQAHEVSIEQLAKLPRKTVTVPDGMNGSIEYQGVPLSEVLAHCGVVLGNELRGPRVASYVLLEAEDKYRVVLAIGEVDPATTDKVILLADQRNGAALGEKEGPFRLVIPDEKRQVRWIRMIKQIRIEQVRNTNPTRFDGTTP